MERVLNARGRVSAVAKLMGITIHKINDKLDQNHAPDQFDHKNTPRTHEVCFHVCYNCHYVPWAHWLMDSVMVQKPVLSDVELTVEVLGAI